MSSQFTFPYSSCYYSLCLLLLFSPLCYSNKNYDGMLCLHGEKQALLDFKYGLVDEANKLASWVDDASDCCRWVGIVCDNVTGHIQHLHLSNQMLSGILSPSILHLEQLRHLDLSGNDFRNIQVPSFIGSLSNLRYLNLAQCRFGGFIPPQLGNLSELNVLSLGRYNVHIRDSGYPEFTAVKNMQWLSSLRQLHYLDMSGVDLSRANDLLQVINSLPSLDQLHMSRSRLPRNSLAPSHNITSLSLLDLFDNPMDTSIGQWIFNIRSLVSLDLSLCVDLDGTILSNIDNYRNLTSLKYLYFGSNSFVGLSLVLEGFSKYIGSNLILLDIKSCYVTNSDLDSLHNLTSIRSLDLSDNCLNKTIPKSLGNFCNLREINLSGNDFSDFNLTSLLQTFFHCKSPRLKSISMSSSGVYGHLPDQLGQLIHLERLILPDNKIVGRIPDSIRRLSFLRSLDLGRNGISGPIPYWIGQLSSLEMLDLSFNQLNGTLPDNLGQLTKLEYLHFSSNLLTGLVTEAHFAKLENLKYLSGNGNYLTLRPRLANWIPPFKIQNLYLSSWVLGPEIPSWLQMQTGLLYLDVSNTSLSSPMPNSFLTSFPNLIYLDMSKNHIQGAITLLDIPATLFSLDLSSNKFIGNLPDLSNGSVPPLLLDLSNNSFEGSLHHLLCSSGVKTTRALILGNNNLSGDIPECWEKWQDLSLLNLENNNLSGNIPTTLGFLVVLESLNMDGNKLSGTLPDSLMKLRNIWILQLARNELVGNIPSELGEYSRLRLLNLRSNNFHGNIPRELCYLTSIQIMDLANNNLSGNIPRCFDKFSLLTGGVDATDTFTFFPLDVLSPPDVSKDIIITESLVMKGREYTYSTILQLVLLLDLSNNSFSGNIPSELTSLLKLKSLNLSRNQLTGKIPEKIGDMKELETFDISLNKLSGQLPTSLSTMNFLLRFNVSYNNLTGKVPSSTQLQTLDESSFIGNRLCGAPLSDCVSVKVPTTINDTDLQDEDVSDGVEWGFIVSLISGFIVGFWMLFAPLIVSKAWRIAYFGFLIRLWYMVYDAMYKYCFNMFSK